MSKILLVDEIHPSNNYGYTCLWGKIEHNTKMINPDEKDGFSERMANDDKATSIGIVGRFLYVLTATFETGQPCMTFVDCGNSIKNAKEFCKHSKLGQDEINMFMSRFEELTGNYNRTFNDYVLKTSL